MLLAAILIKLDDPEGPILFKQERPGKDERIFEVYKFRTMRMEEDFGDKEIANVDRITKIGNILRKTSIDELPQFFNILKGEMSFIGPRPLLVEYLPYYNKEQRKRHDVLPGISGWAQVNGRNTISWEERFKLDTYYVENISFKLDIKILFLTVKKVFMRADINKNEKVTMEKFSDQFKKEEI